MNPVGSILLVALLFLSIVNRESLADVAHTPSSPVVAGYKRFFAHRSASIEGGRLLMTELSCTACHMTNSAGDDTDLHATRLETTDPLQPKRGPILDGAGARFGAPWLRQFLADPQHTKPGTTMPGLFEHVDDQAKQQQIDAIVHFLMSKRDPLWKRVTKGKTHEVIELLASSYQRGYQLYHRVGCVACHAPNSKFGEDSGETDEADGEETSQPTDIAPSVPLGKLSEKYSHEKLTSFLHAPLKGRPSGRMPNMKLSVLEAADVAHYLLQARVPQRDETFAPDDRIVIQGERLFRSIGCANCHDVAGVKTTLKSKPLAKLEPANQGCLEKDAMHRVRFSLTNHQRESLRLALSNSTQKRQTQGKQGLNHSLLKFNCFACHERHDLGSATASSVVHGGVGARRWEFFRTEGNVDFGDEGRIPPSLTSVGNKLTKRGFENVLAGTGDVRPHMLARMPKFGMQNVGHLPQHFMDVDSASNDWRPPVKSNENPAGRQLVNQSCLQCHSINGRKMTGVVGVDLSNLQDRLQPAWFRAFLLRPGAVKRRTRMPTLFTGGKSVVTDILKGDSEQQIAAMWTYLKNTKDAQLPEKLTQDSQQSFELVPRNEPIMLRTFMVEAGTHAIAVGFPSQLHFAFDAETARLAIAWKGRFLDAHGTWFDRFTPPAKPLGEKKFSFPNGGAFAKLIDSQQAWPVDQSDAYRWRGFRIDKKGVPTFLYTFDDHDEIRKRQSLKVAERIEPAPDGKALLRRVVVKGNMADVWMTIASEELVAAGVNVRVVEPQKASTTTAHGSIRLPVKFSQSQATIEIEYRW